MLVEYCRIAVQGVHMTVLHHLHQVSVFYRCTLFVSLSLQVTVHMTSSHLMPSTLSLRMNPWHICMTVLPAPLQPEKFLCEHFPPQYNIGVFAEEAGKQVDDHHYIGLAPDVVHQDPGYFTL